MERTVKNGSIQKSVKVKPAVNGSLYLSDWFSLAVDPSVVIGLDKQNVLWLQISVSQFGIVEELHRVNQLRVKREIRGKKSGRGGDKEREVVIRRERW